MAYPNAHIFGLTEDGHIDLLNYYDTEHYQVAKEFLNNPERMLNHLL
jgi:predicted ATPase